MTITQFIGWILVLSPFVGIFALGAWLCGLFVLVPFAAAGLIAGVIILGINLIHS